MEFKVGDSVTIPRDSKTHMITSIGTCPNKGLKNYHPSCKDCNGGYHLSNVINPGLNYCPDGPPGWELTKAKDENFEF